MVFESTPPDYSSVNDHLVYVVYDAHASDPVTYPNYKYVGELWINGSKVFTARVVPQPDSGRGIFNFGSVVREYVIGELAPTSAGIVAQELIPGQWCSQGVVVKIREEYDGAVSAVLVEDSARNFFNHYNGRIAFFTQLDDYPDQPITKRHRTINIPFNTVNLFIPYFAEDTAAFDVVISDGTSTNTKTITPAGANSLILINVSPNAINTDFAGFITSSTGRYTVEIGPSTVNNTFTVNLICEGLYSNYMVHFMNQFGGFESMLFNKVRRKTIEVEKKKWQQQPYRVSSTGVVSVKTGDIMHAQQSTFASRFKEMLKLNTDMLNDTEHAWLSELIASPMVWVEDFETLYPVIITDTNYEYREHLVDGLQNVSITVEFGTTYKTQFR